MTNMSRRDLLQAVGFSLAGFSAITAEGASGARPATRLIGSTGESLPVIGLGTWQAFDVGGGEGERGPRAEVLRELVALGGKLVDSSPMYGEAETVVGDLAAKQGLTKKLFLATKVWTSGKEAGLRQMEDSLRKLRTNKLDLMQVHNLLDVNTHLDTLAGWKKEGRVRYVGVTHYTASHHDDVAEVISRRPVDFVQINYSVGEREAEKRLLPLCKSKGIAVIANRPFVGGDLIRRLKEKPLPAWAAEIDCGSWAQLLLKFVVSHPAITCAIPATSKVAHLRDNMMAGVGRMPNDKQRARIAEAALA